MPAKRIHIFTNGIELWIADVDPNTIPVVAGGLGALCITQIVGSVGLWQCTAGTSTWTNLSVLISGVPLSTITASLADTAIDNLTFRETWAWSGATTQALFSLIANALTSGRILTLSSSSVNQTGAALEILAATTQVLAAGLVHVQASGNHGGALVQLDSATVAGTLLAAAAPSLTTGTLSTMIANALTTGTLLALTTSSAALNSTLGLLRVVNSGASLLGILARFQANSAAGSGVTILTNGNTGFGGSTPVATVHNFGSTVLRSVAIGDLAGGGVIGTAAATVDVASGADVTQTTAAQTLTLPNPTNTTSGRIFVLSNSGAVAFTFATRVIGAGQVCFCWWNGAAWAPAV